MSPRPPALDTAAAISAKPTKCIPPWMIGCSMPNNSVLAVFTRSSCFSIAAFCSMNDLEKSRSAHAAAHAHRNDGVFGLAPAALDQGVAGQSCSGHAIGMANRDRAAIDVELFRIDPELVSAIDHLYRECL